MIINKSPKIEDYPKLPYELEKIDWKQWLLFERRLDYQIINTGFSIRNNVLSVRNLRYNNKTIAFEYGTEFNKVILHLPVLIEENGIISSYLFAVDPIKYQQLISKIYSLNIQNMGCGCKDEAKKIIIDFINDVFESRRIAVNYRFHNFFFKFNPWEMKNNRYHKKEVQKAVEDLHDYDLIKITNIKTGEKHFGVAFIDGRDKTEIGEYRCYLIDPDYQYSDFCDRYFLPLDLSGCPMKWKFSKANIDEMSDKQKDYYLSLKNEGKYDE